MVSRVARAALTACLLLQTWEAWSELDVSITPPDPAPGYLVLGAELDAALASGEGAVRATLGALGHKPLLLAAFADTAARSACPAVALSGRPLTRLSVRVSSQLSVRLPTLDVGELESVLASFAVDDDLDLGMAYQVWAAELAVSGERVVPGTRAFISGGAWRLSLLGGEMSAWLVAAGATWRFLRGAGRLVQWEGLGVSLGVAAGGLDLRFGLPDLEASWSVTFDPDREGPFPALRGSVDVRADLTAGVRSRALVLPLELGTGARFLGLVRVGLGMGVAAAVGSAALVVDSSGSVNLGGTLAPYQRAEGSIRIAGELQRVAPELLHPWVGASLGLGVAGASIDAVLRYYGTGEWTLSAGVGVSI